jgi:O-antigen chain-terminating methyltransferase
VSQDRPGSNDELILRLQALVAQLQEEQAAAVPGSEPYLASRSAVKGAAKRTIFRVTRPATRRSDRLATELAAISLELAERLQSVDAAIERLRGDIDRLDLITHERSLESPSAEAGPPRVDDSYYWAFEGRMRGDPTSVSERLRQYERFAVPLRERLSAGNGDEPPLWLDLGCGRGEFCSLVREWGWRVHGVDSSPTAVDECRARGIDTTLADVRTYLETRRDEPPAAISAIQLIEHVPQADWLGLLDRLHALLAPGGALLIETINGLNPEAVAASFIADVTHTWPGHPETLRLMAEHAGFADVEVVFINPDERGNAQDFAIWAVKASTADRR